MFKTTPEKLQELQDRAKKRYTQKYRADYIEQNKLIQARKEAKILQQQLAEQKRQIRLAKKAEKEAQLLAEIENGRRIPQKVNWEKVQEYLNQVPLP